MKKILVVADTHKNTLALKRAYRQAGKIDYLFHLGDSASDTAGLGDIKPVQVLRVRGNCDFSSAKLQEEIYLCGQKILLLHGHTKRVKYSLTMLGLFADEQQAEAVLFGHTHIPCIAYSHAGRLLFNPGSLGEPRNGKPTFGLLLVTKDGIFPKIVTLG